ncbi:hypothetical protein MtrunA17_Chr7g0230461 [Medicago truncatula]|uniref:Uncharacterized protein n=2 Tax=Medicago truncatula TaxID=3880 RepID=A0A396GWB6_MEDTR|nr:hypothetical protein MtrunA17_Chr7g0230461 [Medicago truncatula]
MKFPPLTPNKYLFALHFKIKFPPLPTSDLALAFRPPYPKWFPCDSLLGMSQKFIPKEKDKVTVAKCNIYNFRGRLHLDLHHVRIISPMGIAVALKSGDGKEDDVAGAQTRSKYKSEKSFKKEKSSKARKEKQHFLLSHLQKGPRIQKLKINLMSHLKLSKLLILPRSQRRKSVERKGTKRSRNPLLKWRQVRTSQTKQVPRVKKRGHKDSKPNSAHSCVGDNVSKSIEHINVNDSKRAPLHSTDTLMELPILEERDVIETKPPATNLEVDSPHQHPEIHVKDLENNPSR